jgi:hypothetical protein
MTDVVEGVVDSAVQDAFTRAFTNFKGTVTFEHKVNLGNYESMSAAAFVQFDYAPDADGEQFSERARDGMNRAKGVVWEALDQEAYWEGEGASAVLKLVQQQFPGSVVETAEAVVRDAADTAPRADVPATPPHAKADVDAASEAMKKAMRKENSQWAKARYAVAPREFYDNRAKKASDPSWSNSPDFTHKDSRVGFWDD